MSKMLRLEAVAARLGDTPLKTVRNWVSAGKLQAYKPGRHPLVKETDLDIFIESNGKLPGATPAKPRRQ
jgi:excisionase family DNA binding protein